jgi:CDP-diglyceride synthetase
MENNTAQTLGWLGLAGLFVGLGQLLGSEQKLTWRIVVGRTLSSTALGISAAAFLAWIPDLSTTALVGIACALASLGTSAIERVIQRVIGVK